MHIYTPCTYFSIVEFSSRKNSPSTNQTKDNLALRILPAASCSLINPPCPNDRSEFANRRSIGNDRQTTSDDKVAEWGLIVVAERGIMSILIREK